MRLHLSNDCNVTNDYQDRRGPWLPQTWALGGIPKKSVDVPITAVFLVLFMLGAATHMTIFQLNLRRGHKFLFNAVLFGKAISYVFYNY